MTFLCLRVPFGVSGQRSVYDDWTWKDDSGHVRSQDDLWKILWQHKLWVESKGKSGSKGDLSGADLKGADLIGWELSGANLSSANLSDSHLNGAHLAGANLTNANLSGADLRNSALSAVSSLVGTFISPGDAKGLLQAVKPGSGADLRGAFLINTDMTRAHLDDANVAGAHFEPSHLPFLNIASAPGLELMTYDEYPGPLNELRKQFLDAGYREAERKITCALNRREAELAPPIECWFKRLAFEYPCQYGLSPGRPLRIVVWLWLVFAIVYAVFMHLPGPSGVYFIASRVWRGRSNTQGIQVRPRALRTAQWWKVPFLWLRREGRVLRAALFFSLMSTFNIGFRDINFGRWLRMLTTREYDLKALGWARTVSGFQSLLSVYLIALWVLTYFGRPFG